MLKRFDELFFCTKTSQIIGPIFELKNGTAPSHNASFSIITFSIAR